MNRAAIISAVVGLVFAALFFGGVASAQNCGYPACEVTMSTSGQCDEPDREMCECVERVASGVDVVSLASYGCGWNGSECTTGWVFEAYRGTYPACDCTAGSPGPASSTGWDADPDGTCYEGCRLRTTGTGAGIALGNGPMIWIVNTEKTGEQCSASDGGEPSPDPDGLACDMSVGICIDVNGGKQYCADTENGRVCTSYPGPSCGADSVSAICAGDPPPTPPDPPVTPEGDPPTTPPPDKETQAHESSADGSWDTDIKFWSGGGSSGGGGDDPGDGGDDPPGDGGDDPPGGGGGDTCDPETDPECSDDGGSGDDGGVCNPATDPDCDGSGDDGSGGDDPPGDGGDGDDGSGDDGDGECDPETDPECSGDDDSAGGGGTCDAPPTCSGDVIACNALVMQWRTWCAVDSLFDGSDVSDPGESDYGDMHDPGDAWADGGDDGDADPLDQIDDSGWLGARDCPELPGASLMGMTVDLSQSIPCDAWRILAVLILLGGWAQSAYIVGRSV